MQHLLLGSWPKEYIRLWCVLVDIYWELVWGNVVVANILATCTNTAHTSHTSLIAHCSHQECIHVAVTLSHYDIMHADSPLIFHLFLNCLSSHLLLSSFTTTFFCPPLSHTHTLLLVVFKVQSSNTWWWSVGTRWEDITQKISNSRTHSIIG